ncbi:hypothetical protein C0Q70_04491 [Pomacea canaliculata]|uniref:Uncharacterized protein n=1 Tax=Pomacea canaliculata TaxID=400727 RepID=A0A2T7PIN0_POMCA|nr:hypothetical protein C0Q70_04491 [Pomacea canaliculata]
MLMTEFCEPWREHGDTDRAGEIDDGRVSTFSCWPDLTGLRGKKKRQAVVYSWAKQVLMNRNLPGVCVGACVRAVGGTWEVEDGGGACRLPASILIWEQHLHDAVLSLCVFEDSGTWRVFAGLADGTVAVLDMEYILCSSLHDYTSDGHLCGGCHLSRVFHLSTLDAMDSFAVSSNPYDHILTLQPGLPGVWISVRGSSILELWDPDALDDEMYFNKARITCICILTTQSGLEQGRET